jgi:hypothetical protein
VVSPIFVVIDRVAGMPWFWVAGDGICCAVLGVVVLWLSQDVGHVSERARGETA